MSEYVVDGTQFQCDQCGAPHTLTVFSSPAKAQGKKMGNMSNCKILPNGGPCKKILIAGSPTPCALPSDPSSAGQSKLKIDGALALGSGCEFKCPAGGSLKVLSPGQTKAKAGASAGSAAGVAAGGVVAAGMVAGGGGGGSDDEDEKKDKPDKEVQKKLDRAEKKLDNQKEHLTKRDLEAAWKENSKGEVVCRKADGTPFDHVDEVSNAQVGLKKVITQTKKILNNGSGSPAQQAKAKELLSEASNLLDHSKGYLP